MTRQEEIFHKALSLTKRLKRFPSTAEFLMLSDLPVGAIKHSFGNLTFLKKLVDKELGLSKKTSKKPTSLQALIKEVANEATK